MKILSFFQWNQQNNDEKYLTFRIVLHDRHKNFYELVTPSQRDQRQRKQWKNKETNTTAIIL